MSAERSIVVRGIVFLIGDDARLYPYRYKCSKCGWFRRTTTAQAREVAMERHAKKHEK